MRTIVHLSDLHFGRTDEALLTPLASVIAKLAPDLIAVSGDLTQRARTAQFKAARAFLDRLPKPQIIVPGNHDVPLYNVFTRFVGPLTRYQRYITGDLFPFYVDDEIAALGINTARSLTFKRGRINSTQIDRAKELLCRLDPKIIRILVTHHPFDLPDRRASNQRVGRADLAMKMLSACRCDLLLAGHLHVSEAGSVAMGFAGGTHDVIVVQAGTATSTRARGELNSFNAIHVEAAHIEVQRFGWRPLESVFESMGSEHFDRTTAGWKSRLPPGVS
ncbi:MAG TPA: metallophosphoesterase family protein [Casimicrobiaceae bacterium]|nr:metallophosphoesterase family protein [Casimicrobiaceae bacterium]